MAHAGPGGTMSRKFLFAIVSGLAVTAVTLTGCTRKPQQAAPQAVPVSVSYPIEREITDYADYTGRTAAVDSVEVRARVWGYLDKINFKEGALVKKGDVLFEIDPRPYQAVLTQAEGNLAVAQARLVRTDADLARAKSLPSGSLTQQELDKFIADQGEAAASVLAQTAAVKQAKLDLDYTKLLAPVNGRMSRYLVTQGNLIRSGSSPGGVALTTIVSVDPMYAYFDVDERTVLRVRQLIREGKAKSARDAEIPVWLALANEEGFPHKGVISFVDNQINSKTGTLRLRGTFENKNETLAPGYFVRVRVPIGHSHQGLLITERALDTDQGQKIVYVVEKDNKVVSRPVRLGAIHGGLREITEGLTPGDRIIVNGLLQVRPGVTVEPTRVDMPVHSEAKRQNGGASKSDMPVRSEVKNQKPEDSKTGSP